MGQNQNRHQTSILTGITKIFFPMFIDEHCFASQGRCICIFIIILWSIHVSKTSLHVIPARAGPNPIWAAIPVVITLLKSRLPCSVKHCKSSSLEKTSSFSQLCAPATFLALVNLSWFLVSCLWDFLNLFSSSSPDSASELFVINSYLWRSFAVEHRIPPNTLKHKCV